LQVRLFDNPALSNLIAASARHYEVSSAIHAEDFIFHYLLNAAVEPSQGVQQYFQSGRESAQHAVAICKQHGTVPRRILDFASGYGCVTRHLPGLFPRSKVFASDVLPSCVAFVSECLTVQSLLSTRVPEELTIRKRFDLIIALSLFSHLPERTFSRWLRRITALAAPGGLVIFTTHGRVSAPHFGNPTLTAEGFWHSPRSEHHELDRAHYGLSVCTREYCESCIAEIRAVKLLDYREGFWWGHQDTFVLQKEQAATPLQRVRKLLAPCALI
jgi:SAM-dependent methyltransferase